MKTTLYTALLMLIVSVSACKKDTTYTCTSPCSKCDKANETSVIICQADYDSTTAYGLAVDVYEAQDYDCSNTTGDTEKAVSEFERNALQEDNYTCTED